MQFLYNNPDRKSLRRKLRGDQTEAERMLWKFLRAKQLGRKFYRQYSVGRYILDFYCPTCRLAIELDGGQHVEEEQLKNDGERDEYLRKHDIQILRFWNNEVTENIEGVISKITESLDRNPLYSPLP